MKRYYLSLHSKGGREYEDAIELREKLEKQGMERTNNPYEADRIVACFYGDTREEIRGYALEMKLLELIHEKNPVKIYVLGPVTELVSFSSLYPFVTSWTEGKTWSDFAREPGWNGLLAYVYDDCQRQITEELKKAKIPKFLTQPESAGAAEESICTWIAIDEFMDEKGLKSKIDTSGYDEELSFSLCMFLKMISRDVLRARKGTLEKEFDSVTENIRKVAKAYK